MAGVGLATGAGAGEGLETLLTRMREEEEMARRQRDTASVISTRDSTTQRANESADVLNNFARLKLDSLQKVLGGGSGGMGTTGAGEPSDDGQLAMGNTPRGRTLMQIAGLNPVESYGSVPQPAKPKGPEDFSAEESFYNGIASKAGYPDYKQWARADPDSMAKARRQWATENHFVSPSMSSEPMVQINDPDNPGQTIYVPRSQAAGKRGPMSGPQKDKTTAYNEALDLADEILDLGTKTKWQGIGPIAGPVGSVGKKYFGVGSDDAERLRDKISKLRAVASFAEGGKQFTGTEKELVDNFLANYQQNPQAVADRLLEFKQSGERSLAALGAPRDSRLANHGTITNTGKPGGGSAGGGSGDMYDEYLKRTSKPKGGGL